MALRFDTAVDMTCAVERYMRMAHVMRNLVAELSTLDGDSVSKHMSGYTYRQDQDAMLVWVSFIDCAPARTITLIMPSILIVRHRKIKEFEAVNVTSSDFTYLTWDRSKPVTSQLKLTVDQALHLFNSGPWLPENILENGIRVSVALVGRSFKEQLALDALMMLN